MIARGFKSVIWVAAVGGAALGCYMVSLRVATERADLARVEGQIVSAQRDLRSLQTELGTRGRMTQLEDWNSNVLALSAPSSEQFVRDQVTLARLERREPTVADQSADVRLASAETGADATPAHPEMGVPPAPSKPAPRVVTAVAAAPPPTPPLIHQASYTPAAALKAKPATAPAPAFAKTPAHPAATKPTFATHSAATAGRPKPVEIAATAKPAKPKPAPITAIAAPAKANAVAAPHKPVRAAAAAPSHDKPAPRPASVAAAPRGGKGGGSSGR